MGLTAASAAPSITLVVPEELRPLMHSRRRRERATVLDDGVSTLGHLVGSLGIPLTEVGELVVHGVAVPAGLRPRPGMVVELTARRRPQQAPTDPPRFVLDVHLGTLARRLRLLGVDAAWRNDATDDELVATALRERRVVLTRDRGILLRRAARDGAFVRGERPDDQLADVLDRFAPPLAPRTRCLSCNGLLVPTPKDEIAHLLQPGTRRTYHAFARCLECGQVYWMGAHTARLQQIIDQHSRAGDPSG